MNFRLIGAGTRDDIEYTVTDKWLTIPNIVTMARFLLVPLFVYLMVVDEYMAAFITLVVLFSTDWIDGYLARRLNQISLVGKWLDPLADRLGIMIVVLTVIFSDEAPPWLAIFVIGPDVWLAILNMVLFAGNPELDVTTLGKVRTAMLMVGIPLLVLDAGWESQEFVRWIALVFLILGCLGTLLAAIDYTIKSFRKYRTLKTMGLNPRARKTWSTAYGHDPIQPASRWPEGFGFSHPKET